MHPIWCTPPVRFVDLEPEKDVAALKMAVEGHGADVVDEVAVHAAGAEMDAGTGVLFVEEKEIADEVNGDFDAASDDG